MKVFTAEEGNGTLLLIHAEPHYTSEAFKTAVLEWLNAQLGDERISFDVELFEWPDPHWASAWLDGPVINGETWGTMAEKCLLGRYVWAYAGDGDGEYRWREGA